MVRDANRFHTLRMAFVLAWTIGDVATRECEITASEYAREHKRWLC
jgi:hypothetical protein